MDDILQPQVDAILKAGPIRLRPILMTSMAMIFGMLPTALGQAANAEFRAPMAIAIIGGLITSTLLTLLVIPVVYTYIDRFSLGRRVSAEAPESTPGDLGPAPGGASPAAAPGLSRRTRLSEE